jgi:hypothetical protein
MRRALLRSLAVMAYGGLPPRRPDQADPSTRAGVAPGASSGVLRARQVIISGLGPGLFVYSAAPAAGDLIDSIAAQAGPDPTGFNAALEGVTSYLPGGGRAVNLLDSVLGFYSGPAGGAGPWTKNVAFQQSGQAVLLQSLTARSMLQLGVSNPQANVIWMFPSGDTSGVTDAANFIGSVTLGSNPTYVFVAPGAYYFAMSQNVQIDQHARGPVYVIGAGIESCVFNFLGTFGGVNSDGIRWFSSATGANAYLPGGGAFKGVTLDGAGVTAALGPSSLLHIGDLYNFEIDIAVQNMPAAVGYGVWFDNQYLFMEQLHGRIHVHNCGNPAVLFDNSANISGAATGSFDRAELAIMLDQKGKGDCVKFDEGAFITDGHLAIKGNTDYGAAKFWVLNIQGADAGGNQSRITQSTLEIGVELNAIVGTQPGTIRFGTTGPSGNQIFQCDGLIDFSGNHLFAVSNNDHSFFYTGATYGDNNLPSCGPVSDAVFKMGFALPNNGTIPTKFFRQVQVTPAGNVTGIIMDAFLPDDWRRITVKNKSAFSVTFAAAGTSHVATGTAVVIAANMCQDFEYDPDVNLWYAVQ